METIKSSGNPLRSSDNIGSAEHMSAFAKPASISENSDALEAIKLKKTYIDRPKDYPVRVDIPGALSLDRDRSVTTRVFMQAILNAIESDKLDTSKGINSEEVRNAINKEIYEVARNRVNASGASLLSPNHPI